MNPLVIWLTKSGHPNPTYRALQSVRNPTCLPCKLKPDPVALARPSRFARLPTGLSMSDMPTSALASRRDIWPVFFPFWCMSRKQNDDTTMTYYTRPAGFSVLLWVLLSPSILYPHHHSFIFPSTHVLSSTTALRLPSNSITSALAQVLRNLISSYWTWVMGRALTPMTPTPHSPHRPCA